MGYRDTEHFNGKTPHVLNREEWKEPAKKSKDVLTFTLDETWSEMRTQALGRKVFHYHVVNETKGSEYSTEFFEGINGEPCGVCNCPSAVVCKHIKVTLKDLLENRDEEFGSRATLEGDFMLRVLE